MPRGGRRSGTPGKAYGNRSDLNTNRTPPVTRIPGQPYGAQAAQVRAQQSVPVGPTPTPTPMVPLPTPGGVGSAPTGTPVVPLDAPTTRPTEPLTAGVNVGPGPGAPPMSQPAEDPLIQELRAIYLAYPNEDLRELLEDVDTGRTF